MRRPRVYTSLGVEGGLGSSGTGEGGSKTRGALSDPLHNPSSCGVAQAGAGNKAAGYHNKGPMGHTMCISGDHRVVGYQAGKAPWAWCRPHLTLLGPLSPSNLSSQPGSPFSQHRKYHTTTQSNKAKASSLALCGLVWQASFAVTAK